MTTPGPGSRAPRPSLGRGWFRLATALESTLRFLVVGHLGHAALDLWGVRMIDGWEEDPAGYDLNEAQLLDSVSVWGSSALTLLALLCLVLFIIWLYRAHRSDRMQPGNLQYRSGWAIGGWFVPVLNLWRPVQMVLDVRRGVSWAAPTTVVVAWWWTFLGGGVLKRIGDAAVPDESTPAPDLLDDLQLALQLELAAAVMTAAAAVLGALVVRSTTDLVRGSAQAAPAVTHA